MKSGSGDFKIEYESGFLQVKDTSGNYPVDLKQRLLDFAVHSLKFIATLPNKKEYDVIKFQLSKSATSIGANYEESQTSTYNEFLHKVKIALREANESTYWFKIINELNISDTNQNHTLLSESQEIAKILGSIAVKVDKMRKQKNAK